MNGSLVEVGGQNKADSSSEKPTDKLVRPEDKPGSIVDLDEEIEKYETEEREREEKRFRRENTPSVPKVSLL